MLLIIGCINFRGLWSPWKQDNRLNDLKSLSVDAEARLFDPRELIDSFSGYEIFYLVMLFKNSLDLEIKTVFLDPECKLVVLDKNSSKGGAFRLMAAYTPTGSGRFD